MLICMYSSACGIFVERKVLGVVLLVFKLRLQSLSVLIKCTLSSILLKSWQFEVL